MQAAAPPINFEERHPETRKTRITSSKNNIVGGFSSIGHAVSCQQVSPLPLILKQKTTVGSSRAKRSDLLPRSLNQCHAFPTHVPRFIVKPAVSHPCQSPIKNWIISTRVSDRDPHYLDRFFCQKKYTSTWLWFFEKSVPKWIFSMVFLDVLVLSQCVASACVNEVKTEQRLSSPLIAGSTLQRKKNSQQQWISNLNPLRFP